MKYRQSLILSLLEVLVVGIICGLPCVSFADVHLIAQEGSHLRLVYEGDEDEIRKLRSGVQRSLAGVSGAVISPDDELSTHTFYVDIDPMVPPTMDYYPVVNQTGRSEFTLYSPAVMPGCWKTTRTSLWHKIGDATDAACPYAGFITVAVANDIHGDASPAITKAIPVWVTETIEKVTDETINDLARRWGTLGKPIVKIAASPVSSGIQAHVTRNGVILFEVSPELFSENTPMFRQKYLSPLVRHEVVHLWNNGRYAFQEEAPPWLYEGVAQYVGIKMSLEKGDLTKEEARWLVNDSFNQCASLLKADERANRTSPNFAYKCGVAIFWMEDAAARPLHNDVYSIWNAIFRTSRSRENIYSENELVSAEAQTGISGLKNLRHRLLTAKTPADFQAVAEIAQSNGINLRFAPSGASLRQALLQPILAWDCAKGRIGFSDDDRSAILDPLTTCASIPKGAHFSKVEGADLFAAPDRAYEQAKEACRSRNKIKLLAQGEGPVQEVVVACKSIFDVPTSEFIVDVVPMGQMDKKSLSIRK